MVHRRGPLALLLACCLWLVPVAAAHADEATAAAGSTLARLTWQPGDFGVTAEDIRLEIRRGGVVALAGDLVVNGPFAVFDNGVAPPPVRIVELDGAGEPEVLVSVFSGGASCCFGARVYAWDGRRYTRSKLLALGSGYELRRRGAGPPLFSTTASLWLTGPHVCAGYPLQLIRYRERRFRDVTARHPSALERDARRWRDMLQRPCGAQPAVGFLGAYVSDLRRLERHRAAERAIVRARQRGFFGSASGAITEQRFRSTLASFLRRLRAQELPDRP